MADEEKNIEQVDGKTEERGNDQQSAETNADEVQGNETTEAVAEVVEEGKAQEETTEALGEDEAKEGTGEASAEVDAQEEVKEAAGEGEAKEETGEAADDGEAKEKTEEAAGESEAKEETGEAAGEGEAKEETAEAKEDEAGGETGEAAGEGESKEETGEAVGEGEAKEETGETAGESEAKEDEAGGETGEAAGEGEAKEETGEGEDEGEAKEETGEGKDEGEAKEETAGEGEGKEETEDADTPAADVGETPAVSEEPEAAKGEAEKAKASNDVESAEKQAKEDHEETEVDPNKWLKTPMADNPLSSSEGKDRNEGDDVPAPPPLFLESADKTGDGEDKPVEVPPTALHPVWSFGLNRHVPVINLSNPSRSWIFYACAHLGIIYDVSANTQTVLQGHSNAITCTAASADKRWLVTGDKGTDSLIVIWDSVTGMPVRSMFEPHPNGVVAVAMTPDARYLATLSAEPIQTFAIWDWTTGDELPLCSATLSPDYGLQNYIMFNPADVSHVVTNSESQVLFYCWKGGRLEYFAPPLTDKDFNKPVGKYSNSVFLSDSSRALTATSQGLIVVWDSNTPLTKVLQEATPDKKAVKLVPMHDRGINVLTVTGDMIVTGDTAGVVKFFDQSLQLTYWYQNFNFGPINSLSFAHNVSLMSEDEAVTTRYPKDCTIPSTSFVVRDFVLGTSTAVFATVDVNGTVVKVVHRDHDAPVHALAAHPSQPRIVVGGFSGLLKVWNYQTKQVEISRYFERGNQIRCCSYDPNGIYIALGFVNGVVRVLDALTLKDITMEPFHYAREEVTHLAFSMDSTLLATADGENTTSLFRRGLETEDEDTWVYVGRHRAHYKPICDVLFGVHLDTGTPRLLTLGIDRFLVEYDIPNSSKDNLPILQKDRIEQSSCPLSMTWYPPITKEQFLCTSNDQFKLKLYNTTTKMCRKTLLGPTYGSPISKMCVVSHPDALPSDRRYLAFMIKDKVGLVILPLDGNPHNSMCLVAHPAGVTNLASSYDGRYIFTAGGTDTSVHMWAVHTMVLDAQSRLGGEDLTPFYGLLEDGRSGRLFAELEDYFYYAQLRSQGINTMDARRVSTHIPISEVPFVMRALGFYPTEQEIEDMMNEIKFSRYVDTGEYVTEIDLAGFIRLFVNHRPAFGLDIERIVWAFDKLGQGSEGENRLIDRMDLLDILQSCGEHMSEYELAEYITTLLGYNPEGGSCELEEFDPSTAGDIIEDNLPTSINAETFTQNILSLGSFVSSASVPEKTEKRSTEVQTA